MAKHEYLIYCKATFSGAWVRVAANSEEEAREKFNSGEWLDGVETNGAELVDYTLSRVELDD